MVDRATLLRVFFVANFIIILSVSANAGEAGTKLTTTFPFASAIAHRIANGEIKKVRVSGDINGVSVSGSGVYSYSPAIAENFSEQPVMSNRETLISMVSDRDGKITPELGFDYIIYHDSDYRYLAEIKQRRDADLDYGSYTVSNEKISAPLTIHANDFGSLSSMTVYKDQTKAVKLRTITSSYVVEPDTASSVIYRISERHYGKTGNFIKSVEGRYRFDESGNCALVSIDYWFKNSTLHYLVQ